MKEEDKLKFTKLAAISKLYNDTNISPNWKKIKEKGDFGAYSMNSHEGLILKSTGVLPLTPIEMVSWLSDEEAKKDFDEMFDRGVRIENLPSEILLVHLYFKGKFIMSPRDFVCSIAWEYDANTGSYLMVAASV